MEDTLERLKNRSPSEEKPLGGFYKDGFPVILFEPHIFHRYTNGKYATSHPHLSYPTWGQRPYPNTAGVRKNFEEACTLDRDAAIQSTSFGLFQVMGFHWKTLGYMSPSHYFDCMCKSENEQLMAFTLFVQKNNLGPKLKAHDWAGFARGYNGAGFAKNQYDTKMAAAYNKLKGG